MVPFVNVILSDKEHSTLTNVYLHYNKHKAGDISIPKRVLTSLVDIFLKATNEMIFGQGSLGWVYSFVMLRTCGRRRGGAMLLHMRVHYTAGMCRSACEMNQSHSTGQDMKQPDVFCLCGFVLRLMAGRRCTVMY